jgi:acyl-CoA hydrolase
MTASHTRLIDIVFPGDTNHHGTLFGGTGLAHMDKVAFIAASRHANVDFVTASCERIDFEAPAHMGEIVELTGRVVRAGRRSLGVEVEMVAEALLTGERRRCSLGTFNMVAVNIGDGFTMPFLPEECQPQDDALRMVEMVFPDQTSHYGSLYGGNALAAMAKAAFVAATRHSRQSMVLAGSRRTDFRSQVRNGELIELVPKVATTGRTSITVEVNLWAENLRSGDRRCCGQGEYTLVAVDDDHRATALSSAVA